MAKILVSVIGAVLMGVLVSLICCFISKFSWKIPSVEPLLFLFGAMICYVLADLCLFSGVIAVMVSAFTL